MRKVLKKVIQFEILYKLFIICLANPLMNEIYQTYVASRGLNFNKDIIATFSSVNGLLIFTALFLCAGILVFYEYAVVIHIIKLCRDGEEFKLPQVLKGSVWNFNSLKGWNLILSAFVFVLVIPFTNILWASTMVPVVEIPWFIQGEMIRSFIGIVGLLAIYAAHFILYLLTMFVPIYMVMGQQTLLTAVSSNLKFLKKMAWKYKVTATGGAIFYFFATPYITWITSRKRLEYKDFDLDFAKYLVHTQGFWLDFLIWLAFTAVSVIVLAGSVYLLVVVWENYEGRERNHYPVWESDWAVVLQILGRHGRAFSVKMKKKRNMVVAATVVFGVAVYVAAGALSPVTDVHRPWIIGHRGSSAGIENTMEAVKGASDLNCAFAEVDVQLTKDGVPVLIHDTNLWRLSGERVNVADLTLKELQARKIRDRNHPGEEGWIPTLEEAIRFAKNAKSGMGLLIELKPSGGNEKELAAAVIKLVEKFDFGDRTIFMSLYYDCIYPITTAHPEWWVGYCIFGTSGDIDDSIWKYDIDFLAPEENQISYSLVYQARTHGLPVYVWTVYDFEKARQYLQMGVSGIITDYPELMRPEMEKFLRGSSEKQYQWRGEGYPKSGVFLQQ